MSDSCVSFSLYNWASQSCVAFSLKEKCPDLYKMIVEDDIDLSSFSIAWRLMSVSSSRRKVGFGFGKGKSLVSGTTAKPFRQKGTGRARQGSKRSVQFRGGGICFGFPRGRRVSKFSLTSKEWKCALRNYIAAMIKGGSLFLVDNFSSHSLSKTSSFCSDLSSLFAASDCNHVIKNEQSVVLFAKADEKCRITSSNLSWLSVCDVNDCFWWEVFSAKVLLFELEQFDMLVSRLFAKGGE